METTACSKRCIEASCTRSQPIGDYHQCIKCNGHLHAWCGQPATTNETDSRRICSSCDMSIKDRSEAKDNIQHDVVENERITHASTQEVVPRKAPSLQTTLQAKINALSASSKVQTDGIKKKRTRLDVTTKLQAATELRQGNSLKDSHSMSQSHVMSKYNISRRYCSKLKAEHDKLQNMVATSDIGRIKSLKGGQFPEIEERLLSFLQAARKAGLSVTRDIFHCRAIQIRDSIVSEGLYAKDLEALKKFSASENWVKKFVKRHDIRSTRLHGEAGSVNPMLIKEGITKLRNELSSYSAGNIYNMDETGLFYRLLPKITYVLREDSGTVRGVKGMKAKDRVTLILASNADGSHKIPVCMIGTAQRPRAFELRPCPLPYLSQKRAWNDGKTCRKWFLTVFVPAIRRRTSKLVALILDNASSHGETISDPVGQVTIFYLPPNCTAVHQPMDCGVIAALKIKYKFNFLERVVNLLEKRDALKKASKGMLDGTKGIMEGHQPHVLDAAEMVYDVWENVSSTTLARCWLKACILPLAMEADLKKTFQKVRCLQQNITMNYRI